MNSKNKCYFILEFTENIDLDNLFSPNQGIGGTMHTCKWTFTTTTKFLKEYFLANFLFRCIKQQFIEPYYWSNIKKHREKYRYIFKGSKLLFTGESQFNTEEVTFILQ